MSHKHLPALTLLVTLTLAAVLAVDFDTPWDDGFTYECPSGQALTSLYSEHSNYYEDRRWKFTCGPGPNAAVSTRCQWSDYANDVIRPLSYICPANQVINGVSAFHNYLYEDRSTRFKCCDLKAHVTTGCQLSDSLNSYDNPMSYSVPDGRVLVGWFSEYSSSHKDRRFKMYTCALRQL